jgi:hypothetical protein
MREAAKIGPAAVALVEAISVSLMFAPILV